MTYEADAAWTALADRTRRAIVMQLAEGERTVGELTDALPVSQPAVSQHLKVLKDAGLVRDEPDGARRLYEVDTRGIEELREWLDLFWDDALEAFKAEAERSARRLRRKKR
jgi:DNA-binding transcriptional ArsR family regulator